MSVGIVMTFGSLVAMGLRFLTPRRTGSQLVDLYIGRIDEIPVNSSKIFHDLRGQEVIVLRTGDGVSGFSNICPHLGCHVHWLAEERIFFCPCHLGKFDSEGKGISGPPADASQRLEKVIVRHDTIAGNLFLQVPAKNT